MTLINILKEKSPETLQVLNYYKKYNKIYIKINSLEKFNWPDSSGFISPNPRTNGFYDVEGAQWEDIYCQYIPEISFTGGKTFYKKFKSWIKDFKKDIKSFGIIKGIFFWIKFSPLNLPYSYWTWTLESFETLKHDYLEEKTNEEVGYYSKENSQKWNACLQKNKINFDYNMFILNIENECIKLSEGFYITKNDPTTFYVDEKIYNFDLKDGWSHNKVGELLSLWVYFMSKSSLDVEIIKS